MKKYASLLLFALLLNGCDDGDLTVETIDFAEVTSTSCDPLTNTLIYKLKPQESLLLNMPAGTIIDEPTPINDPLIYTIDNTSYRVVYRAYDGTVAKENICGAIPPKTPNVTEEWIILPGGKIEITTTAVYKSPAPTDGHTEITGYNHNIIFRNITFEKPSGPQVEPEYIFGDYLTTVTPVVVSFLEPGNAKYCREFKKVYNNNTSNSLVIENFDTTNLFKTEDTPAGQPRKGLINSTATTNNLYYRTYATNLPTPTTDYYCQEKTPTSPIVKDTWVGQAGVTNVSGIIEVTTTSVNKVFTHKVVLKNVTLQKGTSTFKLATEFLLGDVTEIAP